MERRDTAGSWVWVVRASSIVIGLAIGAETIRAAVPGGGGFFSAVDSGVFANLESINAVIVLAAPLVLTGASAAVAARTRLWNIGIEGQLYFGAWAAEGVALGLPRAPVWILFISMFAASAVGGAFWALIPALAKVYADANEAVVSLLLNFVSILWVSYWITGPWHDIAIVGQVQSLPIPNGASLGNWSIDGLQIYGGFLIALGVCVAVGFLLRQTVLGHEIQVTGSSLRAGEYAGVATRRLRITVFAASGAIGGIAGYVQLTGGAHALTTTLSNNYGYVGIAVAVIAGYSLFGVLVVGLLFGGLASTGVSLQITGVDAQTIVAVTGVILLVAAIAERLSTLRILRVTESAGPGTVTSEGRFVAASIDRPAS